MFCIALLYLEKISMEITYKIILVIHITAGAIALLSGLFAIIFRNNVKKHKPVGKIYFLAMTVIFFSAVFMSLYKSNIFLFCVSLFTYYACLTAYRSLKYPLNKNKHLQKLHYEKLN